jgi:hypothetical protein
MDNIFVVGCVISTVLMRDTVVVYASCIIGYYLLLQFQSEVSSGGGHIEVFTDNPGF